MTDAERVAHLERLLLREVQEAEEAANRNWKQEVLRRDHLLDAAEEDMAEMQRDIRSLRAELDEAKNVLAWLDRRGGLGHDAHARIDGVLAAQPPAAPAGEPARTCGYRVIDGRQEYVCECSPSATACPRYSYTLNHGAAPEAAQSCEACGGSGVGTECDVCSGTGVVG